MPAKPHRRAPRPSRLLRLRNFTLAAAFVIFALMDFGLSGHDAAALRSFTAGVDRWQVDPEFRAVAVDYSVRASAAMRVAPVMVPARRVIMGVRSLPLLPKEFAANSTSQLHYDRFARGPLCAYLHLCSEQDVPDYLPLVEALGKKTDPTEADLRGFLDSFKMDFPVAKDSGALASVASLVQETEAGRPFAVRVNIPDLLAPDVTGVARELGVATDPAQMSPDQQMAVLERLDSYVHRHDPELWRTKQVSDFCVGVWAQVFGPPYNFLLVPVLVLHTFSRFGLVALLLGVVGRSSRGRRRASDLTKRQARTEEGADSPTLTTPWGGPGNPVGASSAAASTGVETGTHNMAPV